MLPEASSPKRCENMIESIEKSEIFGLHGKYIFKSPGSDYQVSNLDI